MALIISCSLMSRKVISYIGLYIQFSMLERLAGGGGGKKAL
jgi:hypothetical protein